MRRTGSSSYTVRLALGDGRTFSVTTQDSAALKEIRAFATTADLRPGTVRIVPYRDAPWTNGTSGFKLKDYLGTYENVDTGSGDRTTVEFWLDGDRLAGKETVVNGQTRYARTMRKVKARETGEFTFDLATRAEVGTPSEATVSFSFSSGVSGETGRLSNDGLQIGVKKFVRR